MNDTGEPIGSPAEGQSDAAGQQASQSAPGDAAKSAPETNGPAQPQEQALNQVPSPAQSEVDGNDLELLTQFLIGIVVLGGDAFMQRIREVRGELAAHPEVMAQPASLDKASTGDLARYLAIGLTMRGENLLLQGMRRGFNLSLNTASWSLGWLDRATDNRLMRPVRRPIESRLQQLDRETGRVIREGQLEEQKGRLLAQESVLEIVDDVIDFVAENPEVSAWIREVIGGQSASMAVAMRDNARDFTVASDGLAEDLVRRILRRSPRDTLAESPLAGEPQTMYSPESAGQMVQAHGQSASDPE